MSVELAKFWGGVDVTACGVLLFPPQAVTSKIAKMKKPCPNRLNTMDHLPNHLLIISYHNQKRAGLISKFILFFQLPFSQLHFFQTGYAGVCSLPPPGPVPP